MTQLAANVHCLLLPVETSVLVLPNPAVAEIVDYREPESTTDGPGWFLGWVPWRGVQVPLVAFESVDGGACDEQQRLRIAILNTLNGDPALPFIGIVLRGIPRLLNAGSEVIAAMEGPSSGSVTLANVQVAGEAAMIPDLDALEKLVSGLPPAA